jgi:hypothetical protein
MNPNQAWIDLPPAELAALILPWFGSRQPSEQWTIQREVVAWLTGSKPRIAFAVQTALEPFANPHVRAVAEAIQALEHRGLLMRSIVVDDNYVGITRLGMHALQTNTVREHLGLGPTT